jgi:hypothetical protein
MKDNKGLRERVEGTCTPRVGMHLQFLKNGGMNLQENVIIRE